MSDIEPSQGESSETQFVEQSGDEENLWEVIEITAERPGRYRVKWAGTDPATGKPWAQSWVPKHDCTPALVNSWKEKELARKNRQSTAGSSRSTARKSGTPSTTRKSTTPAVSATSSSKPSSKRQRRDSSPEVVMISVPHKKRKIKNEDDDYMEATLLSVDQKGVDKMPAAKTAKKPHVIASASVDELSVGEEATSGTLRSRPNGSDSPVKSRDETRAIIPSRKVLNPPKRVHQHNSPSTPTHRGSTTPRSQNTRTSPPPTLLTPPSQNVEPSTPNSKTYNQKARSPRLTPSTEARLALWEREVNYHAVDDSPQQNDNSYHNGFVPETQQTTSSSQTSPIRLPTILDIPSTPRENMISRMKPKTPVSRSISQLAITDSAPDAPPLKALEPQPSKVLRPIPVLTPSTFAPHLPSMDSIESVESDGIADETIDQYSSPIKPPLDGKHRRPRISKKRPAKSVPSREVSEALKSKRPQELSETNKLRRAVNGDKGEVEETHGQAHPRTTASPPVLADDSHTIEDSDIRIDLIATQEKPQSPGPLPVTEEVDDPRVALREEEEENTQDSLLRHPSVAKVHDLEPNEETGNADIAKPAPMESVPKISEAEPPLGINDWKTPSENIQQRHRSRSKSTTLHRDIPDESTVNTTDLPSTAPTSQESGERNSSQRSQSYPPTQVRHLSDVLALLNVKSEEISRMESELTAERAKNSTLAKEIEALQESLAQAQIASATAAELDLAHEQHAVDQTSWKEQLDSLTASVKALTIAKAELESERVLWQSEKDRILVDKADSERENAALKQLVESSEAAQRELELERDRWKTERDQFLADKSKWELERASLIESLESAKKRQSDSETERSQWHVEKEGLEAELGTLKASLEAAQSAKKSAEGDRDFFREQYAQASGFVTSVREENEELEKRAKIAESQASTGVQSVRMLYESRITAAEQEAARWKYLTNILTERDMRTGGDDIRRRANLEPELRKRVEELEHIVAQMEDEMSALEDKTTILEKEKEQSEHRNDVWKKTVKVQASEIAKWNRLSASQQSAKENSVEPSQLSSQEGELVYPNGSSDEMVYRCLWRFETSQPPFSCNAIFTDLKDLETHVISVHADGGSEDAS